MLHWARQLVGSAIVNIIYNLSHPLSHKTNIEYCVGYFGHVSIPHWSGPDRNPHEDYISARRVTISKHVMRIGLRHLSYYRNWTGHCMTCLMSKAFKKWRGFCFVVIFILPTITTRNYKSSKLVLFVTCAFQWTMNFYTTLMINTFEPTIANTL